ncbi:MULTISPECIES: hypothetical protein [Nocardia]|uniref:hypothetical protein n=1 Tax=Nocardia TaxID=1817 RepID=UPI002456EAE1|nr:MULTISPECIES: hypothetical protein [Nocardia]
MQRFWRFHWNDCPEFSAVNAYSALWGRERSADGSQTRCGCDGENRYDTVECGACRDLPPQQAAACDACGGAGEVFVDCRVCGGSGWEDCICGYSCFSDPDQLIDYLHHRVGAIDDGHGEVIVFDGAQVDTGFDDEPTAIPETVLERLTWTQFLAGLRREAA